MAPPPVPTGVTLDTAGFARLLRLRKPALKSPQFPFAPLSTSIIPVPDLARPVVVLPMRIAFVLRVENRFAEEINPGAEVDVRSLANTVFAETVAAPVPPIAIGNGVVLKIGIAVLPTTPNHEFPEAVACVKVTAPVDAELLKRTVSPVMELTPPPPPPPVPPIV